MIVLSFSFSSRNNRIISASSCRDGERFCVKDVMIESLIVRHAAIARIIRVVMRSDCRRELDLAIVLERRSTREFSKLVVKMVELGMKT